MNSKMDIPGIHPFWVIGISIFILFNSTSALSQEVTGNSCVDCHADMWEEMKDSVHSQQQITCHRCHGGDPTKADQDAAKAPETGYIGVPEKKQIMQICGGCHADVEVMNFYGIRTDQLAQYKTSQHGKSLLEGNSRVAVCSDCHGYHDVLSVSDPNSTVYALNLPKTCNKCHGNEKIMNHYDLPTDIFEKYKNSVHGRALFEKKDTGVANCASCHGSHGAVPPGVKDIGATCGKCHVNEKNNFLESVHAKVVEQGKFSECVSCHSNHEVAPANVAMYDHVCAQCHQPQSPAFQVGQRIHDLLQRSENELSETTMIVKQAAIEGIFVEEEEGLLEEAKTKVVEMQPLQHTLSYQKLAEVYGQAEARTTEIKKMIADKRQGLKWRKIALIPIWIFVFIMSWALIMKYKQLKGHG